MIQDLIKRYKAGIHPCMLWFLIQYYYDDKTEAMYDGNHIDTEYDTVAPSGKHIALYKYGYQHLIDGFIDLSDFERSLLKKYIQQYE